MLKMCKEEFDRLMETSPTINENIIKLFNETFPLKKPVINDEDDDIDKPDIKRPEICDELVSTAEIVFVTVEADDKEAKMVELVRKKNKILENYEKEVRTWINKFEDMHNRKPLESEMMDNLQDKMNPEILAKIVKKITNEFNDENNEDPFNKV
jgi:hypothetical protein